jgi:diaminopimelate decarboxylase
MHIENGRYCLDGVDLVDLTQEFGCPLYVYSTQTIARKYQELVEAFPVKKLKINYACKSLTNLNILNFIRSLGSGLDTVSIQEVRLGLPGWI